MIEDGFVGWLLEVREDEGGVMKVVIPVLLLASSSGVKTLLINEGSTWEVVHCLNKMIWVVYSCYFQIYVLRVPRYLGISTVHCTETAVAQTAGASWENSKPSTDLYRSLSR